MKDKNDKDQTGMWSNRASVQITRTMKDILFNKWMLLAFSLILIPFIISLYMLADPVSDIEQWPELFNVLAIVIFMQILLLMFSLVYGASMMNEEIESRTATYLFLRGSKRFEVQLYKFIGTYVSLSILFTISMVLTYFTLSLHTSYDIMSDQIMQLMALLGAFYFGLFAYLALFSLIGVLFKHPLVVGLIFAFFWEVIMVNIPVNVQQITIMYYVRSIYLGTEAVRKFGDIDQKGGVVGSIIALILIGLSSLLLASLAISKKDIH